MKQPGSQARSRLPAWHRLRPTAAASALGLPLAAGWRTCPLPCERKAGGRAGRMPEEAWFGQPGFQAHGWPRLGHHLRTAARRNALRSSFAAGCSSYPLLCGKGGRRVGGPEIQIKSFIYKRLINTLSLFC